MKANPYDAGSAAVSTSTKRSLATYGLKYLLLLPCWAAAIYGSLQLHGMDLNFGHQICGRWGCGPAAEALLGFHGFALLLIVPGALLVGTVLSSRHRLTLGRALLWGGLLLMLVHVVVDGVGFYQRVGSFEVSFQRALFSVAIAVDRPFLQVILAGLCLRFLPRAEASELSESGEFADCAALHKATPELSGV